MEPLSNSFFINVIFDEKSKTQVFNNANKSFVDNQWNNVSSIEFDTEDNEFMNVRPAFLNVKFLLFILNLKIEIVVNSLVDELLIDQIVLREVYQPTSTVSPPTENSENSPTSGFKTYYIYIIVGASVAVIAAIVVGIIVYKKKTKLREFDNSDSIHNNKAYLYDF